MSKMDAQYIVRHWVGQTWFWPLH